MSNVNVALVLVLSACTFEIGDEKCCKNLPNIVLLMFLLSDATQESFYLKNKSFYSLFTAHLISCFIRRLVCRVFAFLHLGYQLWKNKKKGWSGGFWWFLLSKHIPPTFSGVKNTVGLGVAYVASFGFAVMLKSADLTEVVFAPAAGKTIFKKTSTDDQLCWRYSQNSLTLSRWDFWRSPCRWSTWRADPPHRCSPRSSRHLKESRLVFGKRSHTLMNADTHWLHICPPPAPSQSASRVCSLIGREGTCSCLKMGHENFACKRRRSFTDDWSFRDTTFITYLQNHRNQSPYNLCRYLAGSPTWLWLWGVQVLGSALSCLKSLRSSQWNKV